MTMVGRIFRVLIGSMLIASALILALPAISAAEDNSTGGVVNLSDPFSYCKAKGGEYVRTPGTGNAGAICVINGYSCNAIDFMRGKCQPSDYVWARNRWDPDTMPSYVTECERRGGAITTIHSPRGNIVVCMYPDGRYYEIGQSTTGGDWLSMSDDDGDPWRRSANRWLMEWS
jgi:putative hemolysin